MCKDNSHEDSNGNRQTKFLDKLDRITNWRKKELSDIKKDVWDGSKINTKTKERYLKYGILMLYSHWEGAIKDMANEYLRYVSGLKKSHRELKMNFLMLEMQKSIPQLMETEKAHIWSGFLKDIFDKVTSGEARIPKNCISAQSNLNSEVFSDILIKIGIDYGDLQGSEKIIDETLLASRNMVAHGQHFSAVTAITDYEDYEKVHDRIVDKINKFKEKIEQAVVEEHYLDRDPLYDKRSVKNKE
jgi:hypothetical protein